MLAGKIDIGSMGDYPLLINGARGQQLSRPRPELVSVTGYNLARRAQHRRRRPGLAARQPRRPQGQEGLRPASAPPATARWSRRCEQRRDRPGRRTSSSRTSSPPVGASALRVRQRRTRSRSSSPGPACWSSRARRKAALRRRGAERAHPARRRRPRGVRRPSAPTWSRPSCRPSSTPPTYLHEHPVDAAENVAEATGLPAEVVYLYNGANGIATFDPTIKPELRRAPSSRTCPFLSRSASIADPRSTRRRDFVDDRYAQAGRHRHRTPPRRGLPADGPATPPAGEVWLDGRGHHQPVADPVACCATSARHEQRRPGRYVPDATTGTRWFADRVGLGPGRRPASVPFVTRGRRRTRATDAHPGRRVVSCGATHCRRGGANHRALPRHRPAYAA